MSNEEIKKVLAVILDKISDNTVTAWNDELTEAQDAVITGNLGDEEYNGWLEQLTKLKNEL